MSDAALVVAIGRFREDALAEAYRRHAGATYALSRRITDADTAEEVVQEIFLKLWTDPDKFDPERGSLRSYLLAQAHGRSIDRMRSESSRRKREEREALQTAEAGYDLDREAWDLIVAEGVADVVGHLPIDEREPIQLAYFGGYTYREVAKMLEMPEGTVKSRIRAGLKRLRTNLADTEMEEPWSAS